MTKGRFQSGLFYVCILDAMKNQLFELFLRMTFACHNYLYFCTLLLNMANTNAAYKCLNRE